MAIVEKALGQEHPHVATAHAVTLPDAAVQLRRLAVLLDGQSFHFHNDRH